MIEGSSPTPAEQIVARDIGLTTQSIEHRKKLVGLGPEDGARIALIKELIDAHSAELTETFFSYLAGFEEGRTLLGTRDLADRARVLKREHLTEMVRGEYGSEYVEQRVRLALLYGKANLEPRAFLGAFGRLLNGIGALVMKRSGLESTQAFESFQSLQKVALFDIGIVVDVLVSTRERTIRLQQAAIRELSTPVLSIRERLLLVPLIGIIDTQRARFITENLLGAVRSHRAKVAVIDITGVATIDSRVANHLLQTVAAVRLMGATAIVTGLSPEVAQSLVALGIDLKSMTTAGDLQAGLEEAERVLGYRIVLTSPGASATA